MHHKPTAAEALLAQLKLPFTGEALFDCLTDLTFFMKNGQGEYVLVNQELVVRCGRRHKRELLGRKADAVFPPPLGESYRAQDEWLLKTGASVRNQLELHIYHSGSLGWCLTNKLPLHDRNERVVGLVGISKDLRAPEEKAVGFSAIAVVVDYVQAHYDQPLRVGQLARQAGLSPYQLDQRLRQVFQLSTGQFILKVRMDAALQKLRESDDSIAQIALACGYSEHSSFTRQFQRMIGLSPSEFRKAHGIHRR